MDTAGEQTRRGGTVSHPHGAKSFWIKEYGNYLPNADLDADVRCDLAVIGGGVAGLSAAWHAARDGIGRTVLIEAEVIGFGASGRAGGWIMSQFGMDQLSIHRKYGAERSRAAFSYCRRAMRYTRELIEQHALDSDYRHPGLMRVAFDERWVDDLYKLYEFYQEIGVPDITWLDASGAQSQYSGNENFKGAISDPDLGLLNPCRHVRALKGLAETAGVEIYENTPAIHLERVHGGVRIVTPCGSIVAKRLVIATNAYTHQLQGPLGGELRRVQAPVFARGAVTEPLTKTQWDSIGWQRGNAIESSLDLFHYMAPTVDGRIQFYFIYYGGHPIRDEMEPASNAKGGEISLLHLKRIFPSLADVRMAHNWGGHMSGTRDMVPHLAFIGDERVIYVGGCWGHGLAINHLHGQTISHMLSGTHSDLTDFWMVNRQPQKWPSWPLDFFGKHAAWTMMKWRTRAQIKGSIFDGAEGELSP